LREIDDKRGIHTALSELGSHEAITGNLAQARIAFEEAYALAQEMGELIDESVKLIQLGVLDLRDEDPSAAQDKLKESLSILRDVGFEEPYITAALICYLGCAAAALGQYERAVILFAAGDAIYTRRGFIPIPESIPVFEKYLTAARNQLEETSYETAWDIGLNLKLSDLIEFVLE
jgi:hypothetical protein